MEMDPKKVQMVHGYILIIIIKYLIKWFLKQEFDILNVEF